MMDLGFDSCLSITQRLAHVAVSHAGGRDRQLSPTAVTDTLDDIRDKAPDGGDGGSAIGLRHLPLMLSPGVGLADQTGTGRDRGIAVRCSPLMIPARRR